MSESSKTSPRTTRSQSASQSERQDLSSNNFNSSTNNQSLNVPLTITRNRSHTIDELYTLKKKDLSSQGGQNGENDEEEFRSKISLAQGQIGQLGTLVDLLHASSTDPNQHHYDSDSDSEAEDDHEDNHSSRSGTLSSIDHSSHDHSFDSDHGHHHRHHLHEPHILVEDHDDEDHSHPAAAFTSEPASLEPSTTIKTGENAIASSTTVTAGRSSVKPRVRGQSILKGNASNDRLIHELALDSMDETSAAIERAQDHASLNEEAFEDPETDEGPVYKTSRNGTTGQSAQESHHDDVPPEQRLARIVEEFGPWSDDSEEFIQQIPGALYRGVLIKGLLMLTNKRFCIYAVMPPPASQDEVIRSGPATVHLGNGRFHRTRRSWLELRSDSVTWYTSSDKKYKPLGACRLSNLRDFVPYDQAHPTFVKMILIDGRKRTLEFDTFESAVSWRNDFEAAFFSFKSTADKLRLSLPLQKITRPIRFEPYTNLAERVSITFDPSATTTSSTASTPFSEAESTSEQGSIRSSQDSSVLHEQTVDFGYLKSHVDFGKKLIEATEKARSSPVEEGPLPILEIDSPESTAEMELLKEVVSDGGLAAKFAKWFALPDSPSDLYLVRPVALIRALPTWGALVIGSTSICFWRKGALLADVKMRIPLLDIDDVIPAKAFGFRIYGLAIQIHGSPDCRLDFQSKKTRDEVIEKLKAAVLTAKTSGLSINTNFGPSTTRSFSSASSPAASPGIVSPNGTAGLQTPPSLLSNTSYGTSSSIDSTNVEALAEAVKHAPYQMTESRPKFGVNPSEAVALGQNLDEQVMTPAGGLPVLPRILGTSAKRRVSGLHFVCLTIGSRGDVQPYISLGLQLMADGNKVTIASHPEYRDWVEGFGISYRDVGGDPAALMKLSVEHKMFSPGFFKTSLGHFRQWLDDLFHESWVACQGADVLIESPSTMAGIHVAEALGIPYFRAFTMPWVRTSAYPHAFAANVDLGPTYNSLSYSIFDSIMWKATAGQVNRWRKHELGLKATSEEKMAARKVPFVYNFSSAVVPRPNDWKDHVFISGYWFLDDQKDWTAPEGLLEFIAKARQDGKSILYVGFGSIVVPDAAALTKTIIHAVENADVRIVLSKGWSERGSEAKPDQVKLPDSIFSVPSIAHDRLFPLIDAACHHGGAGTTAASLRSGLPTIICPFFGDQYFWAQRVQKLGVGLRGSLNEKDLTQAFKTATTDRIMRQKAQDLGVKIRSENGPRAALGWIYDHIHYAKERADMRAARAAGTAKIKPETPAALIGRESMTGSTPPTSPGSETPPLSAGPKRSKTCDVVESLLPGRSSRTATLPNLTGFVANSGGPASPKSPLASEPARASTTLGLTSPISSSSSLFKKKDKH